MRMWNLILALILLPACRKAAMEPRINPGVVEPGTRIHGKSYGEWIEQWFKYVFTIPASDNPFLHDDKCEVGQSGPVWFLTGKWGESPVIVIRHCAVPAGVYLFFPVASASSDNVGLSPPRTADELRALCKAATDQYVNTKCWLDGRELQGIGSAIDSPYRAVSPVFQYQAVPGDLRGLPAGMLVDPVVADGMYLMLEPLAGGSHNLRFMGSSLTASDTFDVTYHIDIVSAKK